MNKAVERQIKKIYLEVFKKVFDKKRLSSLASGSKVEIYQAIELLSASSSYDKFAKKFAKELAKKGLSKEIGVWRKFYEAAKKMKYVALPLTYKEYEYNQMTKAIERNFRLIKSMPEDLKVVLNHKYTSTLIEEVAKGTLKRGTFASMLESHGNKHAKLVARTETAKLQTAITESRAKDVGSVAYIWLASNDKRTRQSHKDMNGVVVFWRPDSQKPLLDKMRGNAGEFPNCRCDAQAIVDIADLDKSSYKVYDYRIDKVITMSKKDLIDALERGGL